MRRLLDLVSLSPTRHQIPAEDVRREWIEFDEGNRAEVLVREYGNGASRSPALIVLKFVGAGGRAENFTPHPLEHWPDLTAHVCSINPPGYGNSQGTAGLGTLVPAAVALYDYVLRTFAGSATGAPQILLMGTSLGASTAIAVAAERPAAGLLVRDPPQLTEVIKQRFAWWTLGLAHAAARKVPASLDTMDAATRCQAPALFITSGRDRIVPLACQRSIVEAYGGESREVHFSDADHGQPPADRDLPVYFEGLTWLRARLEL